MSRPFKRDFEDNTSMEELNSQVKERLLDPDIKRNPKATASRWSSKKLWSLRIIQDLINFLRGSQLLGNH